MGLFRLQRPAVLGKWRHSHCSHCSFCNTHPGSRCRGGVRGNEPGRSKARRPVTFECGLPLLHIATLADASQKVSSAGLETWIRGRNNGWLTIARRNAHWRGCGKRFAPALLSKHRPRAVQVMHGFVRFTRGNMNGSEALHASMEGKISEP